MDSPIITQPVKSRAGMKMLIIVSFIVVVGVGAWFAFHYFGAKDAGIGAERQRIIDQISKESAETPSMSPAEKQAVIDQIIKDANPTPVKGGKAAAPTTSVPTPAERQAILDAMAEAEN